VHWILHLLGFDHEIGPREAREMATREQQVLGRAGMVAAEDEADEPAARRRGTVRDAPARSDGEERRPAGRARRPMAGQGRPAKPAKGGRSAAAKGGRATAAKGGGAKEAPPGGRSARTAAPARKKAR
jgi:hypothetical protein